MKSEIIRRDFLGKATLGAAGATAAWSARLPGRVLGANDRINIGLVGCGKRGGGHRHMVEMSFQDQNLGVVAVCDLWNVNREKAAVDCTRRFGADGKQLKYLEAMLQMPELDAVMIAAGDHQHAKLLAEVAGAIPAERPAAISTPDSGTRSVRSWPRAPIARAGNCMGIAGKKKSSKLRPRSDGVVCSRLFAHPFSACTFARRRRPHARPAIAVAAIGGGYRDDGRHPCRDRTRRAKAGGKFANGCAVRPAAE